MDQEQPKPKKIIMGWKFSNETVSSWKETGIVENLNYDKDSNTVVSGIQNSYTWEAPFDANSPAIDVFAIGINPDNSRAEPGFYRSSLIFTLAETGGIDSAQTEFKIMAPSNPNDLQRFDHLVTPDKEIIRIESISEDSMYYTLSVERGAHGTVSGALVYGTSLELLTPRVGMKRIVLLGDEEALPPPSLDDLYPLGGGIYLAWSNSYNDAQKKILSSYRLYYSTTAAIDIDDPETYDGHVGVEGSKSNTVFNPFKSGYPDTDPTFYFVLTAWTLAGFESEASGELSGKAWGTDQPNPNGPITPGIVITITGKYKLRSEAKKPTNLDSALGQANAAEVTFQLYFAGEGAANPSTDEKPEGQTLVGEFVDGAIPYYYETVVDSYGFGKYWCRGKVKDGAGQVGSWGLSEVIILDDKNNTTDMVAPTGVYLNAIVKSRKTVSGHTSATILYGIAATGNHESASQCQFASRHGGSGPFVEDAEDPWPSDYSSIHTWGAYPAVESLGYLDWEVVEVTARVQNVYGWSNWCAPVKVTLAGVDIDEDSGVCDLAEFGAWTRDDEPPDGFSTEIPEPGIGQVTFSYKLGDTNRSTVHRLAIAGTNAATIPEESVIKNQSNGRMVAIPGNHYVDIYCFTGFTATENQFTDKFLKIGQSPGPNGQDTLQVFAISSNTAGDHFRVTLAGSERVRNIDSDGGVEKWSIIEKPIWSLADFYMDMAISAEYFGAIPSQSAAFKVNTTGMKFWAFVNNGWGIGNPRYADGSSIEGSEVATEAEYVKIGGVGTNDLDDSAVTAIKVDAVLQPIAQDIVFTSTSNNSFSWSSGSVQFADGSSINLASGSKSSLDTDSNYWVSFNPTSPGGGLTATTSISTALSNGKVILAIGSTTSDTAEKMTIIPRWGSGINIGAQNIVCEYLSSITAEVGELTGGTITGLLIRTAPSGTRIEMDSTNGFQNIDSNNTTRIHLPASSSKISLTSGYSASSGMAETGWIEFKNQFHIIGGVGILPDESTSRSGYFLLGSSGGLYTYNAFHTIELVGSVNICIELIESNFRAGIFLSDSGISFQTGALGNIYINPGMGGDLIISGSEENNVSLDSSGNLALTGDLSIKDNVEFLGSGTSYLKMKDNGGTTRYLYCDSSGNPTTSTSAP